MLVSKKIVLTGAPSTGKTSLMQRLSHPEVTCFEEVSRTLIATAQKEGVQNPFVSKPMAFSEALFDQRLKDYFSERKTRIHLYDRGIHDVVAYLNQIGEKIPDTMLKNCSKYTYDIAFVLPPWEAIYTKDSERLESFEEAVKLHQALISTYKAFGMKCIEIPKGSLEVREAFILTHL
jgi:predicted ATPase